MSDMADEFLHWLDVIPGRAWLVLGDQAAALAALIPAYLPSAINVANSYVEPLPLPDGGFDVVIGGLSARPPAAIVADMRRLVWPAGLVALHTSGPAADLERLFQEAGLHAIQSRTLLDGSKAIKGVR